MLAQNNIDDFLIGIFRKGIFQKSLYCCNFMIKFAKEALFTILWNFRNCRYSSCILSAQKVAFITPMALDLIDQLIINLW